MSLRNGRSKQACFQGENRRPGIAGADLSFLDFPKLCSNSVVRGHSIREPSHPNGNQPSMVMRSAKRRKTRDRTASAEAHQTGMGKCNIALQKPLNALPGRCRLGQ